MNTDQFKVGMSVRVGERYAYKHHYAPIIGKDAIVTHVDNHPSDGRNTGRVYVCVLDDQDRMYQGSYAEYHHPTLMHLAKPNSPLYSWFIHTEDALILDNESYMEALPLW